MYLKSENVVLQFTPPGSFLPLVVFQCVFLSTRNARFRADAPGVGRKASDPEASSSLSWALREAASWNNEVCAQTLGPGDGRWHWRGQCKAGPQMGTWASSSWNKCRSCWRRALRDSGTCWGVGAGVLRDSGGALGGQFLQRRNNCILYNDYNKQKQHHSISRTHSISPFLLAGLPLAFQTPWAILPQWRLPSRLLPPPTSTLNISKTQHSHSISNVPPWVSFWKLEMSASTTTSQISQTRRWVDAQ